MHSIEKNADEKDTILRLLIFGLIWLVVEVVKSVCEPTIPAENWKNVSKTWDVFNLDAKEFQKNLRNGKYK